MINQDPPPDRGSTLRLARPCYDGRMMVRLLVAVLVLGLVPRSTAAAPVPAEPDAACAQLLQRGLAALLDGASSTAAAQREAGVSRYAGCRRQRNQQLERGLRPGTVAQLRRFQQALVALDRGFYPALDRLTGTGPHSEAQLDAVREDLMARVLGALRAGRTPPAGARRKQGEIFAELLAFADPTPARGTRRERDLAQLRPLRQAVLDLREALRGLPPAALGPILQHLDYNYATDLND